MHANRTDSAKKIIADKKRKKMANRTDEEKADHGRKISEKGSGKLHSQALKIEMRDNENNLLFTSYGTFKNDCEQHGLPYDVFRRLYNRNEPYTQRKQTKQNQHLTKYIGWTASVID